MERKKLLEYLYIVVGTTLLAIGTNVFFNANRMVTGGFSGIGIIVEYYSRTLLPMTIPLSVTNTVLNIPLFIISYFYLGKGVIGRTVFSTLYLSIALEYTKYLPGFTGDLFLAAVFGGAISGFGIGYVFKGLGTTGGVDLVASIIHKRYNHLGVSEMIFVLDCVIIALGLFVFGMERAMYAMVAIYISSKCISTILEGMSFSKAAFIISDHAEEIATRLMTDLGRGVTALNGKGMYTGEEKEVLLCVFSQKEVTKVKATVKAIDSKAFIMVTDFREVLGNGFQSVSDGH